MRRLLLVVLGVGCTEPSEITLALLNGNPLAVGSTVEGVTENTKCDNYGCERFPVEVESFGIEPAGVFEIIGSPAARFALRALAAGTATLTLDATSQGETKRIAQVLVALEANRVVLELPCGGPLMFTIATPVHVYFSLRHDTTPLFGSDYYPFAATGITVDEDASVENLLVITMPSQPGTGQLSSPLDPSATLTFDAIAPTAIDRIEFRPPSTPDVFDVVSVGFDVFSGPTRVCGDTLTRTFTILTADICTFDANGSSTSVSFSGPDHVDVRGLRAGTCMISAALGGTSLVATTAITFTM